MIQWTGATWCATRRDSCGFRHCGTWARSISSRQGQLNVLAEYVLHNISDSDFTLTGPAVSITQILLRELAGRYGYDPLDVSGYNRRYRNPALSYMSAERLLIMYSQGGMALVTRELELLREHGIL